MHTIRILFFSTIKDIVGIRILNLEIPRGMTIRLLIAFLIQKYPRLEKFKDLIVVAVNREFADPDLVIPDRAEVAIFPPVSGG